MTNDFIEREAAINAVLLTKSDADITLVPGSFTNGFREGAKIKEDAILNALADVPAADVRPVPEGGIGEMSDGYHTFNGLYYQRMVLFAALVKAHQDKAWKSRKHEDGELCFGGGWFIVGIDTPKCSYTYHYEEKDWDLFDCVDLPVAKHWDGHTEKDVTRLLSLYDTPCDAGTIEQAELFDGHAQEAERHNSRACDTCPQGAHWDGVVICGKDGQRHERTDGCERGGECK